VKVALVNCAAPRELGRGNIEVQMAPLGVLYLMNWIEICGVEMDLALIDEKRVQRRVGPLPSWTPHGDLDILFYWIRPATLRRSIECASRARAENPKAHLVAIGPGAYGWWNRYTDQGPFDLIVRGGPYGIVEQVLRGKRLKGTVPGDPYMPPVRLPETAARYPIGRLTTTWGAVAATTFCVLPKMQRFDFRETASILAEIDMFMRSPDVKYIEGVDENFFMYPHVVEVIGAFANRKPWGATLNCRRQYGEMARVQDAVSQGLKILKLNIFSRNRRVLRSIGTRFVRHDIDRTFNKTLGLRKSGVKLIVRLLYGLPRQTWDEIMEDIDFFERKGEVYLQLDPLIVQPGTWLWHHRKMSGVTVDDDNRVIETRWMSQAEIQNLVLMASVTNQRLNDVGPRGLIKACSSTA